MKIFLAALIALVFAALVAAAIQYDAGYVLFSYGRTTVEMTVWVALALLLVLMIAVLVIAASIRRGAMVSSQLGAFWSGRKIRRSRRNANTGLIAFIEGNWAKARRLMLNGIEDGDASLSSYLLAAKASHALGDIDDSRKYLALAADTSPGASIAVDLTQAQMQIDSSQYEQALVTLTRLRSSASKHPVVLLMLKTAYAGLQDWPGVIRLAPELRKHSLQSAEELAELEATAYRGQLERHAQEGSDSLLKWWRSLPKVIQREQSLLIPLCAALVDCGDENNAEKVLHAALNTKFSSELIALYGCIAADKPAAQLSFAEGLLKTQPNNAQLLLALGRLSLRNELWGKAKEYFEKSYDAKSDAETCFELARLLNNLGELERAQVINEEGIARSGELLASLPQPDKKL